jgi:hypothetical protein
MDGRGPWDLEGSIREHQQVMRWYGERGVPVELNEPHHWGMRDAPDVVFVVSAFLSAYNARACGVQDYIAQLMFNSPPGHSDAMDLAKMLAVLRMIEPWKVPTSVFGGKPAPDCFPTRWIRCRQGTFIGEHLSTDGAAPPHCAYRRTHRGASRCNCRGRDRSLSDCPAGN